MGPTSSRLGTPHIEVGSASYKSGRLSDFDHTRLMSLEHYR
jgi:hypothetical protein